MTNGNLFLLVTNELARTTLDAISFPVKLSFPEQAADIEGYSLGEAGIEIAGESGFGHRSGSSVAAEDAAEKTAVLLREGETEANDEDLEIFNAYKVEADHLAAQGRDRKPGKLKQALLMPLKKLISVELAWVKLEVDKPNFILGDPILIRDMVVRIQVRFRACGKIFGKRFTKTFTTERIRLEARELELVLQTSGAKVLALPSFTALDVVLNFSLFGFAFASHPGLTTIVNKQLHKRGPLELMDLSSFEKELPFSHGKLRVTSIAFAPDPKGLIVNMTLGIA